MNMNLRELYLADNKLNGLQDSAQLGNLLKFNCYIQILDLRNNHILDSGQAPSRRRGAARAIRPRARRRGKTPGLRPGGGKRRGFPFPARFLTKLRPFGRFVAAFRGEPKRTETPRWRPLVPRVLSRSRTGESSLPSACPSPIPPDFTPNLILPNPPPPKAGR